MDKQKIHEGKAKIVYQTKNPNQLIIEYKDDATAFNGLKKGTISDKGILNLKITTIFFEFLAGNGIPTHFIKNLSDREQLVQAVQIIPVEVVVRNVAAGSLAKRLGLEEGTLLAETVLEFYYKDDALGDPMINNYHIRALDLASDSEIAKMEQLALKVNNLLREFLGTRDLDLIDFKLEFGRTSEGKILLADEISPDTCRFWDTKTKKKLDKDRFRQDLGGVEEAYQEILRRIS